MFTSPTPQNRPDAENLNHHLWNNNGTWWVHYTVHRPDHTKERVRKSLGTSDLQQARTLRDHELKSLRGRKDLALSIRVGRPGLPPTRQVA